MNKDTKLNRMIIAGNIDEDLVGQRLTPEARTRAIDFGMQVFKGDMGNGRAAKLGIQHVTSEIFKDERTGRI